MFFFCFTFLSHLKMTNSNENAPLLGEQSHERPPTLWSSFKVTMKSSFINYLLIFVPIAIAFSTFIKSSDTTVFTLNFIAIIPLAKLLGFGINIFKVYPFFFLFNTV